MPLKAVQNPRLSRLEEACAEARLSREAFLEFVRKDWIRQAVSGNEEWADEDVARAALIRELLDDFGVNDEAVPIILHLIDQLHALRAILRKPA